MVVYLAENPNRRSADFPCPTLGHVAIASEQYPSILAALSNDFRIVNVLPTIEMVIVYDDTETNLPQFSG